MVRSLCACLLSMSPVGDARVMEHAALLQSKTGQPHQHAKNSASIHNVANQSDDTGNDRLHHVDKHISNLETRLQQGPVVEQSEIDDLEDIVKLLSDEFGGELSRQHDEDVEELAENVRKHNECESTKDQKLIDLVGPKSAQVSATRTIHRNCRVADHALQQYVNDANQVATSWTNLANYKANPNLAGNSNLCQQTSGSHALFHQHVATYDAVENSGTCGADQLMFERAFCEHYEQKAEVCIEMDTCVSTVDLAGDISRKTDRVKHRKAMDLTLAKLDCRLNHVITTYKAQLEQGGKYVADVTDNCDDVTGDPSKFDITFDLPDLVTCSGDADINNPTQPSKEDAAACLDWKNQEYTNPTGALPGENWVCKHSCVAPQNPSQSASPPGPPPPATYAPGAPGNCWPGGDRSKAGKANGYYHQNYPTALVKDSCQKDCDFLGSKCVAFMYYDGWCHLYGDELTRANHVDFKRYKGCDPPEQDFGRGNCKNADNEESVSLGVNEREGNFKWAEYPPAAGNDDGRRTCVVKQ